MTNYFQLYDLPLSFHPNRDLVKKKYYELSKRYHPDFALQLQGNEATQALLLSAQINDAFKTLSNADATMAYLLKLNNLLAQEEKYTLPPTFLMEMMELNELVSDIQPTDDNSINEAETVLNNLLAEWENEVSKLTNRFDNGENTQELLLAIKDYYFRKKYLLRIKERIDKFAAR